MKEYTEDNDKLISIEVAMLAKDCVYSKHTPECFIKEDGDHDCNITDAWTGLIPDGYSFLYYRPTQTSLQKWLREYCKVEVVVIPFHENSMDEESPVSYYQFVNTTGFFGFINQEGIGYSSYETALEIGLIEALTEVKRRLEK